MKKIIVIIVFLLVFMEGISWWVYKASSSKNADEISAVPQERRSPPDSPSNQEKEQDIPRNSSAEKKDPSAVPSSDAGVNISENFPLPSIETRNGITERTVHMGARQWAWDPKVIRAKQGELVRLIIHNADVRHAIVIPELKVEADIPEDGAVVEFKATQKGKFDFLCATYCGAGHVAMQGTLIIE